MLGLWFGGCACLRWLGVVDGGLGGLVVGLLRLIWLCCSFGLAFCGYVY